VSSKPITASKHDPAGPAETIVSKSVANLRSIPTNQAQSVANRLNRQKLITISAYYRATRCSFKCGDEVQGWLDAEAEINGVSQPGGF